MMRIAIDVQDRKEATAIKTAMDDPTTRAFVVIVGLLLPLSANARKRILQFVQAKLEDDAAEAAAAEVFVSGSSSFDAAHDR